METAAIQQFQTHGQDIPWLLEHWAEHKPDHDALVWAPREGTIRRWTYAELLTDVRRVAVGTNTKSVGAEVTYFAEHTGAVAAVTQPQYAAMVAAAAPALKWIAVTDDNSGEPASADESAHGFDAFDVLYGDA